MALSWPSFTKRTWLLLLWVSRIQYLDVGAFPTGAPVESFNELCDSMTPAHTGFVPQSTESPYTIDLSTNTYTPNTRIVVTITAGQSTNGLKGILLVMREAGSNEIVGTWTSPYLTNFQLVSCGEEENNVVTHMNRVVKATILSFEWTPPDTAGTDLYVSATFVQTYFTFWVNVTSEIIQDECMTVAAVSLCNNHGTCETMLDGGVRCNCFSGYSGTSCLANIAPMEEGATTMEIMIGDSNDTMDMMAGADMMDGSNYTMDMMDGGTYTMDMMDGGNDTTDMMDGGNYTNDMMDGGNYTMDMMGGGNYTTDMMGGGNSTKDMMDGGNHTMDMMDGGTYTMEMGVEEANSTMEMTTLSGGPKTSYNALLTLSAFGVVGMLTAFQHH